MTYDAAREEMLPFIPLDARTVLEVGCATGRFGTALRDVRELAQLWGIDPTPGERGSYDRRIEGRYPDDLPSGQKFDCVVFNDVLEHMADPWTALAMTRSVLSDGGVVVASLPNVRNVVHVLRPLVLNGRWKYADTGILDRTHLRFFTRASIIEMFESQRFEVRSIAPINEKRAGKWAALNRMTRGVLTDFIAVQYAVVAQMPVAQK